MAGELVVLLLIAISVDFSVAGRITTDTSRRYIYENGESFTDSTTLSGNIIAVEEPLNGIELNTNVETTINGGKQRGGEKIEDGVILSSTEAEENKIDIVSSEMETVTEETRNIDEGSGNRYIEQSYTVFQTDSLQIGLQPFNGSVRINYNSLKDKPELIQCHVISRRNERFVETLTDFINCGNFPEIPNGKFVLAFGDLPDDIISRVVCDRYYIRVGESSGGLRCLNGVWYHNANCEIVKCSKELPVPSHGQNVSNTGHTVNSTITFSCQYGYELLGNETLACGEDGNWMGTFPSCLLVKCPNPLLPEHGFIKGDNQETVFNTTLVYQCMKGYSLVGKADITCQADGKWNREFPACKPVCLVPNVKGLSKPLWLLPNLEALSDSAEIRYGGQIIYSCKRRFKSAYDGPITCVNGTWFPPIYCIRSSACVKPNIPKHAMIARQIGRSYVQYACKKGFQISNTDTRVCSRKGTWSRPIPECVKSCKIPELFAMKNAEFDNKYRTGNRTLEEVFLHYSCKTGYRKVNETQPKCINATWNPMPQCVSAITRLSYTYSEHIGVAEIFTDGLWGGVCDHFSGIGRWSKSESKVFCGMLGFKSGGKLRAYSSPGVQAKFTGISCSGTETNILRCITKQANVFCSDLVVVSCQGNISLE